MRDAALVDLVPADQMVDTAVSFEPSHGHSPGHVSIRIDAAGASAVLIGDVMHSPLQAAVPHLKPALDRDEGPAREARIALLERYADTDTIVFGAHFHAPSAGRIKRDGAAFRFEALEG